MTTSQLTVRPGQIVGFRQARRHERPGRMYPIFAIAGASPDGDGAGTGEGQAGGQGDGQNSGQAGSQGSHSGQQGGSDSGQSGAQSGDSKGAGSDTWDGKIESLPADVQKLIEKHKTEAANASSKARETARSEAQKEILEKLGLVKGDEKPDPDQLAKDLTETRDGKRAAEVKLAVYQNAATHKGDPAALLDSNSFLAKVAGLDPSASDFADKVGDEIKKAVAANPKLGLVQAAGASGGQFTGGTGEGKARPTSLGAALTAAANQA
jgi:hypothetical protein